MTDIDRALNLAVRLEDKDREREILFSTERVVLSAALVTLALEVKRLRLRCSDLFHQNCVGYIEGSGECKNHIEVAS